MEMKPPQFHIIFIFHSHFTVHPPKLSAFSMRCCINGTFVMTIKFRVLFVIECLVKIHCDAICDCIPMNEFSNVNIVN